MAVHQCVCVALRVYMGRFMFFNFLEEIGQVAGVASVQGFVDMQGQ